MDGYNWWQINYTSAPSGWSVEDYLTSSIAPPPPPPPPPPPTSSFQIGARVKVTANLNVRAKASTAGKKLCTQRIGALGTIVGGPVSGNGYTWWNVNFDTSCDGWSVQTYLQVQ
jgi:hypothetical protein